jgi:hypothetical protein
MGGLFEVVIFRAFELVVELSVREPARIGVSHHHNRTNTKTTVLKVTHLIIRMSIGG